MVASYDRAVVAASLKEISNRIEKAVAGEDQFEVFAALGMAARSLLANLPESVRPLIFRSWMNQICAEAEIKLADPF
jgi:hypothetical protein